VVAARPGPQREETGRGKRQASSLTAGPGYDRMRL